MYNFNRPPFSPNNMPPYPLDQVGSAPVFSPQMASPMGLYQRLPSGAMCDPTFLSPRGDSRPFGGARFPTPPPSAAPQQSRFPFPWSPSVSPFAPQTSSPNFHTRSPRDSGSYGGSYRSSPHTSRRYDSPNSHYTTGYEPDSEWSGFQSARSQRNSNRGRGGGGSGGYEPRWKRGDPIARSLSDPWVDLNPVATPEPGCLVASQLVQRHTVLFAPREQRRRRKASPMDMANHGYDEDDDEGSPAPKRSSFDV